MDDAVQRLLDIEEIKQLKARYWRYLDTQDFASWRTVLTDDFHFEADTYAGTGADEIVRVISTALAGAKTVHRGHRPEITITGADSATGIWSFDDWVEHAPDADGNVRGFRGYGHYHERYVRTPDGWKIGHSVVERLRVVPLGGPMVTADDFDHIPADARRG